MWSVRRELWENKSVYIAPAVVALLVLLAGSIAVSHVVIPPDFDADGEAASRIAPLAGMLAGPIMFTSFVISFFYCLDALYGEKRDRSILFWKSLPISDLVAVSAKAMIPMLVIPAVAVVTAMALQIVVLVVGSAILMARGISVNGFLAGVPLIEFWGLQVVRTAALVLWYAPLYAWLFLVSVTAKRAPFVWAILVPLGIAVLERIAFGTFYVGKVIVDRLIGGGRMMQVAQTDHVKFMSAQPATNILPLVTTLGFWIGLVVAVAVMAVVVYLRRSREPV